MADRNPAGGQRPAGRFQQPGSDSRPGQRQIRSIAKIDSHQHLWRYDPGEYPWIPDSQARLKRDFLPEELRSTLSNTEVEGTLAVQIRQSVKETDGLLELADRWSFIRGIVGWVPLAADNIAEILAGYTQRPKFKGVRHLLQEEADDELMLNQDFNRGLDKLLAYGLAYDLAVSERQLSQLTRFIDLHPYQTFVLDHAGRPRVGEGDMEPWRSHLRDIAERVNVYCKISGLVTEARLSPWKPEDIRPYIDTIFDVFGPERVMFGSEWPILLLETDYRDWLSLCAGAVATFSQSEQRRFWSQTAREAYRL